MRQLQGILTTLSSWCGRQVNSKPPNPINKMEIEGWKSMEPTSLICFNPDCPYEDKRVVNQTATLHLKFEPCRKHMLQAQQLKKHSKEEKEKVMDVLNCNVPLLELNFVKSPVESLKMMFALSQMNWRSTHDNYFRSVKQ